MVFGGALMAMLLSASSFTFNPSVDAPLAGDGPQKKEQKVKVIVRKDGKETKIDTTFNLPEQFDVMIQQGDSGMTKHIRKIIRMGENGDVIGLGDMEDNEFLAPPPPPPPPPLPPFMMNGHFGNDPFAFDTNDENIISYEKKDIGKGLERITIVRKKKNENKENKEVQVKVETSYDSKK